MKKSMIFKCFGAACGFAAVMLSIHAGDEMPIAVNLLAGVMMTCTAVILKEMGR